jgi:hypothetical protein
VIEEWEVAFHLIDGSTKLFHQCTDAEKIETLQRAHTELEALIVALQIKVKSKEEVQ